MSTNSPIKCASAEYTAKPFHLIQANETDRRYVISFQDVEKIRTFMFAFIDRASETVAVKLRDNDDADQPTDYDGDVAPQHLKNVINAFEETVFYDGYTDLMIRLPESGDYVVFDQHGLVFVYTHDDYSEVLQQLENPFNPNEQLIYEVSHWHIRPAKARENLHLLVAELDLQS
jgi:hypothetical protein